jgi:cell division protein WhiA
MSSASRTATSSGRDKLGPGFTRAFREELARLEEKQSCCRLAAVSGLMHTAGSFLIHGGSTEEERYEIRIATTLQSGAKLAYSVFKNYGAEGELVTQREPRFQHRLIYEVHLRGTPAALQALNEMGVLSDSFELQPGIARRLIKKSCCRSAFIRGCLIGAGSANSPSREAHLEILSPHEAFATDLVNLLNHLEFHAGMRSRRGSYVVYLKGRDEVAGLLALAGAHEAALQVEEQSVVREVRSRANRLANCDNANLRRTSTAASQQLEAIAALEKSGRLEALPDALRDMADLRQQYPYMNLTELAEVGGDGLTRSAVNHRLRRLVEAAEGSGARGSYGSMRRGHRTTSRQ